MKNKDMRRLRELVKEAVYDIKRMEMNPAFDEMGDAVTTMSRRAGAVPNYSAVNQRMLQKMAKHYFENHNDEFLEELEKVMMPGKSEDEAMIIVAKRMNQKYREF